VTGTYLKHEILCLDEAKAFLKAQFTPSLPFHGPAFEKGDNDVETQKIL
jgi:hypothetical protein